MCRSAISGAPATAERLDRTLVLTDEAGEERLNLYTVEPDGRFERITDVGYIYGWSISPDGRWLAYASRESVEFSPGTIRLMDLKSRTERVLFTDSKALRPYWSTPAWRADSGAFLLTMVVDEDRALQNVALVTTSGPAAGQPRLVTDKAVRREIVLPKSPWLNDREFIFISTQSGRYELYRGDAEGNATQVSSPLKPGDAGSLTNASVIHVNGKPFAVTVVARPVLDSIYVLELPSGKLVFEQSLPESVSLESSLGDRAILKTTSPSNPVKVLALTGERSAFALKPVAEYAHAADTSVACVPEKVSFRTFDGLAAPGENGTLHAWLYRPKKPLPSDKAMLIVEAFYGGAKPFSSIYPLPVAQIFCAAGIHFLSPAPRGSWGMGVEFRHLIHGDLGGNEILDVVAAAKWGESALGIPAKTHRRVRAESRRLCRDASADPARHDQWTRRRFSLRLRHLRCRHQQSDASCEQLEHPRLVGRADGRCAREGSGEVARSLSRNARGACNRSAAASAWRERQSGAHDRESVNGGKTACAP